jgi:hypothetical protein
LNKLALRSNLAERLIMEKQKMAKKMAKKAAWYYFRKG